MSAKQFPSHQIASNPSLQVGGESMYPLGSQSPVSVGLFLGWKDQSPARSSCPNGFFTAQRQQSETGCPDSPGHGHPLILWRTGVGMLRVKAGKLHFLFGTAGREAQVLCLSSYGFGNWKCSLRRSPLLRIFLFSVKRHRLIKTSPNFKLGHWLNSLAPA